MVVNEFINYWFGKVAKTKRASQLMQRTVYPSIRICFPSLSSLGPFLLSSKRVINSIIVAINIKLLFSLSFLTVKLLRTVNGFVIDSRPVKENTFYEGGPWGAIAHPTNNPSSVEFVPRAFSLISHVPSDRRGTDGGIHWIHVKMLRAESKFGESEIQKRNVRDKAQW